MTQSKSLTPSRAVLCFIVAAATSSLFSNGTAVAFDAQQFSPAVDPQGFFSIYSSKTRPQGKVYVSGWYNFAKDPFTLDFTELDSLGESAGSGGTGGGVGTGGSTGAGGSRDVGIGLLGPLSPITNPVLIPVGGILDPLDPAVNPLLCALLPLTDPLANPVLDPLQDCQFGSGAGGGGGGGGGGGPGGGGALGGATGTPRRIRLVDRLHTVNFVASYALLDWAEVGIDIPVSLIDSEFPGDEEGMVVDDIRLIGKFEILDGETGMIGAAILPYVDLPTGDDNAFTANGHTDFGLSLVVDYTGQHFRTAVNLGYKVNDDPFADDESDEILFGIALGYLVLGEHQVLGADEPRLELIAEVTGATAQRYYFAQDYVTPIEFLLGGRLWHQSGVQGALAAGRRLTDGINAPELRLVASLGYSWQPDPAVEPYVPIPLPPPAALPEPPPPPEPLAKAVMTDEQIVLLEPIYFDTDRATLKSESYSVLEDVVRVLEAHPLVAVRIEGHTDSMGSDAYNQRLSERRAKTVLDYLIARGVAPSRLSSVGWGESRAIATNETAQGRARNRRTEFHIQK